ncbi:hypothetical protein ILUMI_20818 [Ignelater luminosus]|uniref:Uncharacterized protein n=1 Tax=Ignelater luminosus TaxID=2038154 RepID=A0A8K0CFQ4_IGNLU|nr:hypothetical protein ILUMI_20818 [Ignelater luminosus]
MKYALVFSCLLVVAYGLPPEIEQQIKEMFAQLAGECKAEIGATDDEVAQIKAHQLPTTKSGKCFLACMNKKLEFQDKSGKFDKASSIAQLEKLKPFDEDLYHKMKQVGDICYAEELDGADECETAYNMMACWQREADKAGIKPMDF